jgi:hypothetical protein
MRFGTWGRETENGERKRTEPDKDQGKIAHAHEKWRGQPGFQESKRGRGAAKSRVLDPTIGQCLSNNGKGGRRMFGMSGLLLASLHSRREWGQSLAVGSGHSSGRKEPDWPALGSGSKRRGRSK